jgi:predicted SnoaL-like aldol condensation-catalyzing enzyme
MTNKELILRFYDSVFQKKELSSVDRYIGNGFIQHDPRIFDGKDGFRRYCADFFSDDPSLEILYVLADKDMVCIVSKCTYGNHSVDQLFDLYRCADGKIAEHWDCTTRNVENITSVNNNGLF